MIINVNVCNFFVFSLLLVFFAPSVSCFVCMFCSPTVSRVCVYIIRCGVNGWLIKSTQFVLYCLRFTVPLHANTI